jgi:hypothetical protein
MRAKSRDAPAHEHLIDGADGVVMMYDSLAFLSRGIGELDG